MVFVVGMVIMGNVELIGIVVVGGGGRGVAAGRLWGIGEEEGRQKLL